MNETARLETFSDGVFAIAATLLILEITLSGDGSVAHQLIAEWPSYAAYAISFLTLGIVWVNHHTVFTQIGRVDRTFLFINVVFLMIIAFSPFPTRVLAEHLREGSKAAAFAYGLTFTLMAVCYGALWFYAATEPAPDRRRRRPADDLRHLALVRARLARLRAGDAELADLCRPGGRPLRLDRALLRVRELALRPRLERAGDIIGRCAGT